MEFQDIICRYFVLIVLFLRERERIRIEEFPVYGLFGVFMTWGNKVV